MRPPAHWAISWSPKRSWSPAGARGLDLPEDTECRRGGHGGGASLLTGLLPEAEAAYAAAASAGSNRNGEARVAAGATSSVLPVSALRFPDPPLVDALVLLRPWTESDLPANLMKFTDPVVQHHSWPRTSPYGEADAAEFLAPQDQARLLGEELNFALADPLQPSHVHGGGSIYDINLERGRAAVGYWLAPEARGRGLATHATLLMAEWAFDDLGVQRLELHCGPENTASQRVAVRCGFTREGLLRSHAPFKDRRHRHVQPPSRRASARLTDGSRASAPSPTGPRDRGVRFRRSATGRGSLVQRRGAGPRRLRFVRAARRYRAVWWLLPPGAEVCRR